MKENDLFKPNISGETKDIVPIPNDMKNLEKFLESHPYPLYAAVLGTDIDKFLGDYIAKNWLNLHYMSGEDCLFLSAYAPEKVDADVVDYWKKKLKGEYEGIWENVSKPASSYGYARMLKVPYDKLPCLFLGTDLKANQGIVAKIPEWNEKDLTTLFEFVFQKAHESLELNPSDRLGKIESDIDRLYMAKLGSIYVKAHWMEYVKPKEVLGSIIEELIAAVIAGIKKGIGIP